MTNLRCSQAVHVHPCTQPCTHVADSACWVNHSVRGNGVVHGTGATCFACFHMLYMRALPPCSTLFGRGSRGTVVGKGKTGKWTFGREIEYMKYLVPERPASYPARPTYLLLNLGLLFLFFSFPLCRLDRLLSTLCSRLSTSHTSATSFSSNATVKQGFRILGSRYTSPEAGGH